MNTAVANKSNTGITTYLANSAVKNNIESVVGKKEMPQFVSSIVSAVQTNKALAACTNGSILSAALLGQSLKLSPSPQLGQYYLVPYKNKGVDEAQFQLGAKGYKQLAIRSGQYRKIVTSVIKQGELKSYNPITEEFVFEPELDFKRREELEVIGYYGMFELTNGFRKEIYWSKEKMTKHALAYSKGFKKDVRENTAYTFWSKDFDGMAEKTMIRQLISKWGIMSIEMQTAFEKDMSVIRDDGTPDYVDNFTDAREEIADEIQDNANSETFIDADATEKPFNEA